MVFSSNSYNIIASDRRKADHRLVQRAKVIVMDAPKLHVTQAGQQASFKGHQSGVDWVKRFSKSGMAGLEDKLKAGQPLTHPQWCAVP